MEVKNICVGKEYTDKQGDKKTQWSVIGKMFIKEDGKMSIIIDSIPIGWSGSAMVFDQKHEGNQKQGDLPF